jgi:hypothetical protein
MYMYVGMYTIRYLHTYLHQSLDTKHLGLQKPAIITKSIIGKPMPASEGQPYLNGDLDPCALQGQLQLVLRPVVTRRQEKTSLNKINQLKLQ